MIRKLRPLTALFGACCLLLLTGCLQAYKIDVQQGNVVTQEMLDSLKPGMSQRDVRFILGSPMIEDPFHADRWDYVYTLKKGKSKIREQSVVTVLFENAKLKEVIGSPSANTVTEKRQRIEKLEADPEKAKKKKPGALKNAWKKIKSIGRKKPEQN